MATNEAFDELISSWLQETAPARIPEGVLDHTAERTRSSRQQIGWRSFLRGLSMPRLTPALGSAAVVVLAFAAVGVYLGSQSTSRVAPSPSVDPTVAPSSPPGYMWPQSTLEEVQAAQEIADGGYYTWQVAPDMDEAEVSQHHPRGAQIFPRFLEEVLGWEAYLDGHHVPREDGSGLNEGDFLFIRCAPGSMNPLYPADPEGAGCAPTIDEFRYETVKVTVAQPARRGARGIWVVTGWETIGPAVQADPRVVEAEATALVEDFLQARILGDGAEELGVLPDEQMDPDIPLLYATSSGARYVRSEFELVDGPPWPGVGMQSFDVTLFAENNQAVVEQRFSVLRDGAGRLQLLYDRGRPTTENGMAVPAVYRFFDGELTFRVVTPLVPGADEFRDVAIEGLVPDDFSLLLMLADPTPFEQGCVEVQAPTNAETLAQIIGSDTKFDASAPVNVTVGGIPALRMDVVLVPGATICSWSEGDITESGPLLKYARFEMADRARLYLVDLPEGSQARVLAIVAIADEDSFESVMEAAAPIIDSIEFHAP